MQQYIRARELAELLSVSRATIWRWTKNGELPPPSQIGIRSVVWSIDEITNWVQARRKLGEFRE